MEKIQDEKDISKYIIGLPYEEENGCIYLSDRSYCKLCRINNDSFRIKFDGLYEEYNQQYTIKYNDIFKINNVWFYIFFIERKWLLVNRYDKEERIINDFQNLKIKEIGLYPLNFKNLWLYGCIHNKRKWRTWIDTSAKNEPPPDFYNDKLKLMMDVMRIDDYTYIDKKGRVINRHNERESKLIEKLTSKNESLNRIIKEGNLFIIPDSGLRGYEDHNYNFYVNRDRKSVV